MKIEKIDWSTARPILKKVNRELCEAVDDISFTAKSDFFVVSYPYGKIIASHKNGFQYPTRPYGHVFSKIIPFSVVIDKKFEMFIEMGGKSFCYRIYDKGKIFHTIQFIEDSIKHEPIDILNICSGARNTFLLPKISDSIPHRTLSSHFNKPLRKPSSLDDHFYIFRDMAESANLDWNTKLLCFSDEWVSKVKIKKPSLFYTYINYYNNKYDIYSRCIPLYNFLLSYIRTEDNTIPSNTFMYDVIREFFRIGCSQSPAYTPAVNDEFIPFDFIARAYLDVYKLDSIPFAMTPGMLLDNKQPVYYSFSKESLSFKPKKFASTVQASFLIKDSFHKFSTYMKKNDLYSKTQFRKCADGLEISIFNSRKMGGKYPLHTISDPFSYDSRFKTIAAKLHENIENHKAISPFFTGCFGLKLKP